VSKTDIVHTMLCQKPRCSDAFTMRFETGHAFGLTGGHVVEIFHHAAAALGWRICQDDCFTYCPKHSADLALACERCGFADCSCIGGPRFHARTLTKET
jgi:hypothetical protein